MSTIDFEKLVSLNEAFQEEMWDIAVQLHASVKLSDENEALTHSLTSLRRENDLLLNEIQSLKSSLQQNGKNEPLSILPENTVNHNIFELISLSAFSSILSPLQSDEICQFRCLNRSIRSRVDILTSFHSDDVRLPFSPSTLSKQLHFLQSPLRSPLNLGPLGFSSPKMSRTDENGQYPSGGDLSPRRDVGNTLSNYDAALSNASPHMPPSHPRHSLSRESSLSSLSHLETGSSGTSKIHTLSRGATAGASPPSSFRRPSISSVTSHPSTILSETFAGSVKGTDSSKLDYKRVDELLSRLKNANSALTGAKRLIDDLRIKLATAENVKKFLAETMAEKDDQIRSLTDSSRLITVERDQLKELTVYLDTRVKDLENARRRSSIKSLSTHPNPEHEKELDVLRKRVSELEIMLQSEKKRREAAESQVDLHQQLSHMSFSDDNDTL